MQDTSFDDTLLVPRLPPVDPPFGPTRELPTTFAKTRSRNWPWIAIVLALLALAAVRPVNFRASVDAAERSQQADELLQTIKR